LDTGQAHIDTLISGCQQGSRRAQEQLYKNYYRAMMSLCLRYTQNEADAVEALNNGFLKVFRNIQRYEPAQGSLYTWIRTIVIRSCLDYVKARQRVPVARELVEDTELHLAPEVLSRMKAEALLKLVRQLPPGTQAVFNLYAIEGYNHREIGELMGISEGTSKWHLSEARKQLKRMIQEVETGIHE
jgi:RNA polymerase sigma factor (sigma-70 family)